MGAKAIPSGTPFVSGDTAPVVRDKLNANLAWAEEQVQGVEDRFEATVARIVGSGVVAGLAVTAGSGLSVDVSAGVAMVGFEVTRSAPAAGVGVAAEATNYVFLRQDGTVATNTTGEAPAGQASILLATAVAGASAVTSVNNDPTGKPKLSLLPGLGVGEGIAETLMAESLVGFDASAGHRHDGTDSRPIAGTTSNTFEIGDGSAGDKTILAATGAANPPGLRYDDSLDTWRYSDDGTTWKGLAAPSATTSEAGVVELATASEVSAGTDAERAVSPAALAGSAFGRVGLAFTVCGSAEDVAVGDGEDGVAVGAELDGFRVVAVSAAVHTAGATGATEVQVRRRRAGADVDVLSTKCQIESGEYRSADATQQPVVDAANDDLAEGDLLYVDVDGVSGTPPKGLSVVVTGAKG